MVTEVQPPPEEFALQLEVMMANCSGHPCPPAFSWNADMVLHVLKSDPTLRDLEHIQVEGPQMAYLFLFDKQGHWRLTLEAAHAIRTHVVQAFSEWISHSAHFTVNPMLLAEGWYHRMMASERQRQQSRTEYPGRPVSNLASSKSDSPPHPTVCGEHSTCSCKDLPSRRHGVWMGHKGAYKPPVRKASLVLSGKGVSWKLAPFLSR